MPDNEVYLGDGLYAGFYNGMIRLRAPRATGSHEVFLEEHVLVAFERFVADLRAKQEEKSSG